MHLILYSKDRPVAKVNIQNRFTRITLDEVYTPELLPLHVLYTEDDPDEIFDRWFWHRCIPAARDGLNGFLEHTQCSNAHELAVKDRVLSLTDHYWLKKEGEHVKWKDVNFRDNGYSEEIGNIIFGTENKPITEYRSPDLTTNGWLKKAWRRIDGEDFMYKMGSFPYFQEPINEVFCSELAKKFCHLDFVEYELRRVNGKLCSVCKNFVGENMEFVPAFSIYQTEERPSYIAPYDFLIQKCRDFGIRHVKEQLNQMVSFDYLISNTDRHMGNFGFMRNIDTLEFSGMAPLFDNGTSLWDIDVKNASYKNMKEEPFMNWQEEQIKMLKNFDALNINAVKDMSERLFELLSDSGMDLCKVDEVCKKYDERWNRLNKIIEHNHEKKLFKTKELESELTI